MDLERLRSTEGDSAAIDPSTYLHYDVARLRGTGPDAPAPAWVDDDGTVTAVLYDDEIEGLPSEARAWFYVAGSASAAAVVRAIPGAIARHDRSSAEVHFRPEVGSALPTSARVGRVRLIDRGREVPVISDSAVLEGSDGPYVLVEGPDRRTLVRRSVRVGKTFGGLTFVLAGLGARELVLTRSAFFVDAERRQRQKPTIEVRQ
jgi:hypothetical protein